MAGVMPSVLASSIIVVPLTIAQWFALSDLEILNSMNKFLEHGTIGYFIIFGLLIFSFAFFFNSLQNNPKDIAKRLSDNGVFIEGFRPGKNNRINIKENNE